MREIVILSILSVLISGCVSNTGGSNTNDLVIEKWGNNTIVKDVSSVQYKSNVASDAIYVADKVFKTHPEVNELTVMLYASKKDGEFNGKIFQADVTRDSYYKIDYKNMLPENAVNLWSDVKWSSVLK